MVTIVPLAAYASATSELSHGPVPGHGGVE
jgi:hypothetical protein